MVLHVGFQAGTLQVTPSDQYPSGLQVCTAAFCVSVWSPEPGQLDFVVHVDAQQQGTGLLSMATLEDWFSVLTDGPPTVEQQDKAPGQPLAALHNLGLRKTTRRSMLGGGRVQRLGRSTV